MKEKQYPGEDYPPCFDNLDQYKAWIELAKETFGEVVEAAFCTDCTVKFKLRMMREDRCVYPDTFFVMTEEGEIVGLNEAQPNYLARPGKGYVRL